MFKQLNEPTAKDLRAPAALKQPVKRIFINVKLEHQRKNSSESPGRTYL